MMIFIGPITPPVGGFSIITTHVLNRLVSSNYSIFLVNRSKLPLSTTGLTYYIRKCIALLLISLKYTFKKYNVYIALSGGNGQILDLLFALLCRPFCKTLYVHHHSFAYIDKYSPITSFLYLIYPNLIDISLCLDMQNKINCIYRKEFYGNPPSLTISNAAWLQETFAIDNAFLNRSPSTEFGNIRLGFLSKPLFEKGFLDSILLHKKLIESQYNSTLFVAGSTQLEISQFLNKHNINFPENFICLGVIDNDSIDSFFNHIDFLLLPTRYANEVEPLVILEAMSRGIPVLTNKRGCIGCLIPTNILPLVINPSHFVDTNFNFLESCFSNPSLITLASKNCFDKYFQLMSEAKEQSSILINALNL